MNRAVRGCSLLLMTMQKYEKLFSIQNWNVFFIPFFYYGENFVALIGNKCGGIALIS